MWRLAIFFFGGFGGICPILVDRAKMSFLGEGPNWLFGPDWQAALAVFLLAAGCFFILGAVVALAHKETDYWKAVVIGISAPGLITAAAGSGDKEEKSAPVNKAVLSFFSVSPAFAQTPSPATPGGFQLNIAPSGGTNCVACELKVFNSDGSLLATTPLPSGGGSQPLDVPRGADQIQLWAPETNPALIPLDQLRNWQGGGALNLEVQRERNVTNDLWRTFGNKGIQPYDFDVKVTPQM